MRPKRIFLILVLGASSCATHADSVCYDIAYCTTLSSDQEQACEAQGGALKNEASTSGCLGQFEAYFSCADSHYQCNGNVASFPGCEGKFDALNACLAQGRSMNACGELASRLAQCPGFMPPDPTIPPAPCGAPEVCSTRCYLNSVLDLCHPQPAEINQATRCAQTCPV
jgi:hypothetical protein